MIGIDAEYIAFTGLAEVPLDIADPIDAIGRNPAERHASCKSALDHLGRELRLGRRTFMAASQSLYAFYTATQGRPQAERTWRQRAEGAVSALPVSRAADVLS